MFDERKSNQLDRTHGPMTIKHDDSSKSAIEDYL